MKICKKCGAVHRDNKIFCTDCGEKLPKPIPKEEEEKIDRTISRDLDKQYDANDPLAVDLPMKIAAGLHIAAAVFAVLTAIFSNSYNKYYIIYALLFHALAFFEALFPEINWKLSKLGDFFKYENYDSLEPSSRYGFTRKLIVWALLFVGIITTVVVLAGA